MKKIADPFYKNGFAHVTIATGEEEGLANFNAPIFNDGDLLIPEVGIVTISKGNATLSLRNYGSTEEETPPDIQGVKKGRLYWSFRCERFFITVRYPFHNCRHCGMKK